MFLQKKNVLTKKTVLTKKMFLQKLVHKNKLHCVTSHKDKIPFYNTIIDNSI